MSILMTVKMALKSIIANKMRSFLTMLGVIIGVSAVIVLVAIGQGSAESVTERIESMGSNLLQVRISGRGAEDSLEYQETKSLQDIDGILAVAPVVTGTVTVKYGLNSMDVSMEGADSDYQTVRNHGVAEGRFIMSLDVENRQKVVLLGKDVVDELFAGQKPIGESVQINGAKFQVIGVMQEKGSSMGGSSDEKVIIPVSTAQRFLKSSGINSLYIQAESAETVDIAEEGLEAYLIKRFHDDEEQESFRIFNQAEMLSTVNEVAGTFTMMLGGIAGISLLVGGIGIMNIMLVSVTERTREIGIRKAIGAKRQDILIQFLIESAVISGIGGMIGILVAWAGSGLIERYAGITTSMSSAVVLMAFVFSLIVGIFFGMYPANKASRLNPVEALRFE